MAEFILSPRIDSETGATGFEVDSRCRSGYNEKYGVFRARSGKIVQVGELEPDLTKTDAVFLRCGSELVQRELGRRSLQIDASYSLCREVLKKDVCFDAAAGYLTGHIDDTFGHGYDKRMMSLLLRDRERFTEFMGGGEPLGTAVVLNKPGFSNRIVHAAILASQQTDEHEPLFMSRNLYDPIGFYDRQNMARWMGLPHNAPLLALQNQDQFVAETIAESKGGGLKTNAKILGRMAAIDHMNMPSMMSEAAGLFDADDQDLQMLLGLMTALGNPANVDEDALRFLMQGFLF